MKSWLFMAAAALIVFAFWSALSLTQGPPAVFQSRLGQHLFVARCETCHGLSPGDGERYGPNLNGIGAVAGGRRPGISAEEYILESMVNPDAYRVTGTMDAMPAQAAAGLSTEQLGNLAAFLLAQGGQPDYWRLAGTLSSVRPRPAEAVRAVSLETLEGGRTLFFGKGECSRCHALRILPGSRLRAPDLIGVSRASEGDLFESIRHPSRRIVRSYEEWLIWLKGGMLLEGRLMNKTKDTLELLVENESGQLIARTILVAEVEKIQKSEISPMPENDSLGDSEIRQIIAYLRGI
ncbi:MAG: c-type cytochrome [Bryobacteraceae bacterium]